ncbi:hypothetical protein D3C71_1339560 [compost metagenome]
MRHAHARLRGQHGCLGGRHIGAAGQHGAGHAGRDHGQRCVARGGGQHKAAGHLTRQHGQGVGEQGLLALQGQGFGFGGCHFGLHAGHVQIGHIARLQAALREAQCAFVGRQALLHQHLLGLHGAQLQIGLRHVGLHHEARALQQGFARVGVQTCSIAGLREAAEQVQLVRRVEPRRAQRGGHAAAGGVGAALARHAGRCAHLHGAGGVCRAQQGTRFGQPRGGLLDAGVGSARALHQVGQHRVLKAQPPLAARLCLGGGSHCPGCHGQRVATGGEACRYRHTRMRRGDHGLGHAAGQHQGSGQGCQQAAPARCWGCVSGVFQKQIGHG